MLAKTNVLIENVSIMSVQAFEAEDYRNQEIQEAVPAAIPEKNDVKDNYVYYLDDIRRTPLLKKNKKPNYPSELKPVYLPVSVCRHEKFGTIIP